AGRHQPHHGDLARLPRPFWRQERRFSVWPLWHRRRGVRPGRHPLPHLPRRTGGRRRRLLRADHGVAGDAGMGRRGEKRADDHRALRILNYLPQPENLVVVVATWGVGAILLLAGAGLCGRRVAPEQQIVAGWGALCIVLTLW